MKQLIYRDLWLCRKRIAPYVVIVLLFLVPASLTILSARFGNIAKYRSDATTDILDSLGSIGLFAGILILCSAETVSSLNLSDHLSGWYKYLKASGMRSSFIVGQKYIEIALLLVISWLIGLSANRLLGLLAGRESADIGLMGVVMGVVFIYLEYNVMLGFATKGKRNDLLQLIPWLTVMLIWFIMIGIASCREGFMDMLVEKIKLFIENRPLLYTVTLIAVILFSVLNYFLSVYFFDKEKMIKREEKK